MVTIIAVFLFLKEFSMDFRERLENGNFTVQDLSAPKGCKWVDAEDLIREASKQECMNTPDPEIEKLL